MTNDYRITPAANWDGPHGTGWVTDEAGSGKFNERLTRAIAVRMNQVVVQPVDGNVAQDFAQAAAPRSHIARDVIVGGVLAGALVRYARGRR